MDNRWLEDMESTPWENHATEAKKIVIEKGITTIGAYAFRGFENVTSVSIPDSVVSIGERAFRDCVALKDIDVPVSVVEMGYEVFQGTAMMENSDFWEDDLFYVDNCLVGAGRLNEDEGYEETVGVAVTVREGTRLISVNPFDDCYLSSITIPASVTNVGVSFYGTNGKMKKITVVKDNPAFCDVDDVVFSKDLKTLIAYPGAKDGTSFDIPESVETIKAYAFYGCDELESIYIPDSVTKIGDNAFEYCGITQINIPANATISDTALGASITHAASKNQKCEKTL